MGMRILESKLFDSDVVKAIFDHVRNLVVCAFLFAAGSYAGIRPLINPGPWSLYPGWGMILIAVVLMLLNFGEGIRRLSRLPHPRALIIVVSLLYLIVSARVVEIMVTFRAGC
jgi:hypothetical protein